MSYKLAITQKPAYLHVVVTGTNNKANVARYLDEVLAECLERECFKVLVEERLEGPRLPASDVYQIVTSGSAKVEGKLEAFAYVDVNAKGDLMAFAETVALNRGLPARVFRSVADAERWLSSKLEPPTQEENR